MGVVQSAAYPTIFGRLRPDFCIELIIAIIIEKGNKITIDTREVIAFIILAHDSNLKREATVLA